MKTLQKKSTYIFGVLAICFAAILWGFDGTFLTPRLFNLDVAFVVFILHLIPFIIMNSFLFNNYKFLSKFSKEDYIYLGLIALFGGALGTLAIVKALFLVNFNHLSVVLLLQKLQPVFAIFLAFIILKEQLKKNFLLWAGVAIIASYFMAFGFHSPDLQTGSNTWKAALFSLLAAFSFGASTVFSRKILLKYDFKTTTFYRFGFTSLFMLIYVLLTGKLMFSEVTSLNWLMFGIIALLIGIGSMFIYYYGLKKVRASRSTIYELSFPISVLLFDWIFNKSFLSPVQLISAVILVFSILKISLISKK